MLLLDSRIWEPEPEDRRWSKESELLSLLVFFFFSFCWSKCYLWLIYALASRDWVCDESWWHVLMTWRVCLFNRSVWSRYNIRNRNWSFWLNRYGSILEQTEKPLYRSEGLNLKFVFLLLRPSYAVGELLKATSVRIWPKKKEGRLWYTLRDRISRRGSRT